MNSSKNKNFLLQAFSIVFADHLFVVLSIILSLNLLALYYFFLYKVTTLSVFFASNSALYNWLSIISTVLISVFFGIAISFLLWQLKKRKENNIAHFGNSFIASFLGAISTGCPVCGAFLASILGVSGGLAVFPFQGLEVKMVSLGLLTFAILSSAKVISNPTCLPLHKRRIKSLIIPAFIGFSLLFFIAYLPDIADNFNFYFSFQPNSQISSIDSSTDLSETSLAVAAKINPPEGYTINATYGDIGPKLLAAGAIDFEKMRSLYQRAGQPLTQEQIKILTEGSNEKITISPENSYFLLNFLWALGLANKNPILEDGPMAKYGRDKIGNFASTGGWTLGAKKSTELYSASPIIPLNGKEQAILEDFAYNSYRPCCSNPTGFPDCNHGIAALALGEIMVGQGAGADEIFDAFKYFNAFWFPQTYFDVALYFEAKEGKDWAEVDSRLVAGSDYSTPQGWGRARNWLKTNNLIEEAPPGGGGCGV